MITLANVKTALVIDKELSMDYKLLIDVTMIVIAIYVSLIITIFWYVSSVNNN